MKGISEEITTRELIEWAKRDKLRIEVEIEPSEYGPLRRRITVEPWVPYQPYCPNGFKPEDVYFLKKSDPEKDPDPAEAPVKKLYQVGDLIALILMLLSTQFTTGLTLQNALLTAVNAVIVALAAMGAYEMTFAKAGE